MDHKPHIVRLFLVILTVLVASPAMALPLIFTDRAAFDQAVGNSTLLTLDAPEQVNINYSNFTYHATYGNLITFSFELVSGVGVFPGYVALGLSGFFAGATVLEPVMAFGLDITPLPPYCPTCDHTLDPFTPFSIAGLQFQLTQPQFLGFLFDAPTNIAFGTIQQFGFEGHAVSSEYIVDNLSIKTAPEPSSLLLLGSGLAGLAAWRARQRWTGTA